MPVLQSLESPVFGTTPPTASERPPVRVLLAGAGASAFDLGRLINADADLVDVGQVGGADETLQQAKALRPDVVLLDRDLAHDVVLLARELTSLYRPPAVLVRSARPDPVTAIAAIVAGVRGIAGRSYPGEAICDAIRWLAGTGRWLPDIPLPALSRAGSRLHRNDLPILLMLVKGTPLAEIAARLEITAASLDARRSAMLRDMLGEPPPATSDRAKLAHESAPRTTETDAGIALAA